MGTFFWFARSRLVSPKGSPPNIPKYLFSIAFDVFWSPIGAPQLRTPKNGAAQGGAKERPQRVLKVFIFPPNVADIVLLHPLLVHPSPAIRFRNMQDGVGFIHISDTLPESMLDQRIASPKSKNERHAAWERSGTKRNERHAAWERFSCFYGKFGCPPRGPLQMPQTVIF
jgi:hypothetical protein